jgi:hypothetical protein
MSDEIKPDGWVARDTSCGGHVCFHINEPIRENGFWGAEMSVPIKDAKQFDRLTWEDDSVPVSIIPTAELKELRELMEGYKKFMEFWERRGNERCIT